MYVNTESKTPFCLIRITSCYPSHNIPKHGSIGGTQKQIGRHTLMYIVQ